MAAPVRYNGPSMLTVSKPVAEKALRPVAKLLKNVNPNVITLLGLIFPILFFIFVQKGWYVLGLVVFLCNWIDLLDGMVARATGKVTRFGGFLDSTIDRFSDFTVIAVFGFAGIVGWNIIMPLLLVSFLISYIRSRIELASGGRLTAAVGIVERTERLMTVFLGLLLYIFFKDAVLWGYNPTELLFVLLTALSIITVGQRVMFAYKKL